MSQRVVLALPEQPAAPFLALAMDLRTYFELRGYHVSIRYGRQLTDEDITPIDGVELPHILCELSGLVQIEHERAGRT